MVSTPGIFEILWLLFDEVKIVLFSFTSGHTGGRSFVNKRNLEPIFTGTIKLTEALPEAGVEYQEA